MRGVRFLILLLIAVPLGWYAYRDSKKGPADGAPKKDKVFAVEPDKIDELEIKSESGERTTLKKKGNDWEITQPVSGPSDQSTVSGITSNLASLEIQRVIDDKPGDLKEFGLASPRVEVAYKSSAHQQRLQIGDKTPTGSDLYAKLADSNRVFLIPAYLESTFNHGTFDLRDKTVLKVDREQLDKLEVSSDKRTERFEKKNGDWLIAEPPVGKAEFSAVDNLVSRISSLQMKSIVNDATDLKKYGLDKPSLAVRVGSGSSLATLLVGGNAESGSVYARDAARPTVFTIESSVVDDLKKDVSEYRLKDLFDARSFNTSKVEIVRNGQTTTLEKTKTKDKGGNEQDKWRQTAPSPKDLDTAKVESFISAASAARATGFVDSTAQTGLDKPELTINFTYDQGKQERVAFARTGGTVYASRAGSPGAAKIDASTLDAIIKALEELK